MENIEYVTTIGGIKADKSKCWQISNQYHLIGNPSEENSGECYLINGRYYSSFNNTIIFDHFTKSMQLKSAKHVKGVVRVEGDKIIEGYFSSPGGVIGSLWGPLILVTGHRKHRLLDHSVVENSSIFKWDAHNGYYKNKLELSSHSFLKIFPVREEYKRHLNYSASSSLINDISKVYNKFYKGDVDRQSPFKGKTFGLEFETSRGTIPTRLAYKSGLFPLRDGSVGGLEYVTVPIKGEKIVGTVKETTKLLSKYTSYDKDCSLHLHIGGIPRTEEFCLAMFKTMVLIQDSIYELFPLYKKYNFGYKRKSYTKPLPLSVFARLDSTITKDNITRNFGVLFKYLTKVANYSDYGNSLSNVHSHPLDPEGTRKWQTSTRYHLFNIIPLIFGNKKTVEFRVHTPTTDYFKVMNYITLCTMIVNFVEKNTTNILENPEFSKYISLNKIVSNNTTFPSKTRDDLFYYIESRKGYFYENNCKAKIFKDEEDFKYNPYGVSESLSDIKITSVDTNILKEYGIPPHLRSNSPLSSGSFSSTPVDPVSPSFNNPGIYQQIQYGTAGSRNPRTEEPWTIAQMRVALDETFRNASSGLSTNQVMAARQAEQGQIPREENRRGRNTTSHAVDYSLFIEDNNEENS